MKKLLAAVLVLVMVMAAPVSAGAEGLAWNMMALDITKDEWLNRFNSVPEQITGDSLALDGMFFLYESNHRKMYADYPADHITAVLICDDTTDKVVVFSLIVNLSDIPDYDIATQVGSDAISLFMRGIYASDDTLTLTSINTVTDELDFATVATQSETIDSVKRNGNHYIVSNYDNELVLMIKSANEYQTEAEFLAHRESTMSAPEDAGVPRTGELNEELHLLWGIPFGASPDEVAYKAREIAGASLVKSSYSETLYKLDSEQQVSILGFPVDSLSFYFKDKVEDDEGIVITIYPIAYSSASIYFKEHPVGDDFSGIDKGLAEFVSIYKSLQNKYGALSYAYFLTMEGYKQETEVFYEIPLDGINEFDLKTCFRLLPDEHLLRIVFVFKNARVGGVLDANRTKWWNFVIFEDNPIEKPAFTPYRIGEEKEFNWDELPDPESSINIGF